MDQADVTVTELNKGRRKSGIARIRKGALDRMPKVKDGCYNGLSMVLTQTETSSKSRRMNGSGKVCLVNHAS